MSAKSFVISVLLSIIIILLLKINVNLLWLLHLYNI
nr:MAG TPA: hypothetical protein [Caudoviricetes sp.]